MPLQTNTHTHIYTHKHTTHKVYKFKIEKKLMYI